jgi:hypothetical protein
MKHYERLTADGMVMDRAVQLEPGDTPEDFNRSEVKKMLCADRFGLMTIGETLPGRDNTVIKRVA